MRRSFLIAALFFTVWLGASLASYDVAFLSNAITRYFAYGKTDFKEYFFLAWCAFIFFLLTIPLRPIRKKLGYLALGLLVSVQALNFLAHFLYTRRIGASLADATILFVDPNYSPNRLMHMHVSKAMITQLLHLFGFSEAQIYADTGAPFFYVLPSWLVVSTLILTVLAIVATVISIIERREEWSERKFWPHWIGIILTSYMVLRTLFDGGPFVPEFLAAFPALAMLLLRPSLTATALIRKLIPFWLVASLFTFVLGIRVIEIHLFAEFAASIVRVPLFLSLVLLIAEWAASGRAASGRKHLFWLVPVFAVVAIGRGEVDEWRNFHLQLSAGTRFWLMDVVGREYPLRLVASEGPWRVYEGVTTEPSSIRMIHKRFNIPARYGTLMLPGVNCSPDVPFLRSGTMKVLWARKLSEIKRSPMMEHFSLEKCLPDDKSCDFRFDAVVKGCIPDERYQAVLGHLKDMGFDALALTITAQGER